jgi:cysteine-rich repeat protein
VSGDYHNCAIRNDGTAACWGWNGSGESTAPGGTFLQVAAGYFFSCGLRPDHSVECWGQISSEPTDAFVQISAEYKHICGILETGETRCLGWDYPYDDAYSPRELACGECGNGTEEQSEECDDGNLVANDGCSDTCVPDCSAAPKNDCKFAQVSKLRIRDGSDGRPPQLRWDWMKGAHTDDSDVQEPWYWPYHLCFYPDSASLGAQILLPRRGWERFGAIYADPQASFGGVESLEVTQGDQGRARIRLRGAGENIPGTLLPATSYVVQLQSTDSDVCWESVFSSGRSRPGQFTARQRY